jgi:hypothetical protein
MAVTLSVTTLELMQEVTAEVYGIAVQVRDPGPGVLPLEVDAAAKIGGALRRQLQEHAAGAGSSADGSRFFVAVGDAFVASDRFDDDDVAIRLEYVAQRAGRMLTGHRDGQHLDDGVVVLKHLALDPDASVAAGRAALFDLHGDGDEASHVEYILPVVLAGSPGALFTVASDFVQATFANRSLVFSAIALALEPHCAQSVAPCTRLDVLRSDAEVDALVDAEADARTDTPRKARAVDVAAGHHAGSEVTRSDERVFLESAARRIGCRVDEIAELSALPTRVQALQKQALATGEPRLAHSQRVVLVITPETVYVGFKTVDELGAKALERSTMPPFDGAWLGALWSRWFMAHYTVVIETLLQARFKVVAFPLFGWTEWLQTSDAAVAFEPGQGALRALEQVHIETSTHDLTEGARGAHVLCRLMLDDAPAPAGVSGDPELSESPVLCSVVRVVDETGQGVSQSNIYLTTPSAAISHHEYAGSLAQFHGLPVEAGIHELVVCDQCLKLIVPPGEAETEADDDEGDDAEDDEVRLRYIAPPRQGRLH